MAQSVGIIGLGNMGRGIAANIAEAGFDTLVWDVSEVARLALPDVTRAVSPVQMAAEADMILFVVPGSAQIEDMLDPILSNARPGLIL